MNDTNNMDDDLPKTFTNLDTFSEELEKQTKETQRLQVEVENATKRTMERIGYMFTTHSTNNTASQLSYTPMLVMDGSSEDSSDVPSSCRQSVIQALPYGLDGLHLDVAPHNVPFPGKDVLENAIADYSQQVSDLQKQLSETHEQHERQNFSFRQAIIKLQTKLLEVQMEKDAMADLRTKESRKHTSQMGSLQATIVELQATNPCGDQRLLEAEEEAKDLSMKAKSMDQAVDKVYCTLSVYEKRLGNTSGIGKDVAGRGQDSLAAAVERVLQNFEQENNKLRERLLQAEERLGSLQEQCQGTEEVNVMEQQERMEQLITSHDQKVAILTEKLSSSMSSASNLRVQLNLLQKQAESQALIHKNQVSDLEYALTILHSDQQDAQRVHAEKVGCLEKLLAQSQSQAEEAQRGRDLSLLQEQESALERARGELSQEKERSGRLSEQDRAHRETIDRLQRELGQRSLGALELHGLVGALQQDCLVQKEAQLCGDKQQQRLQQELGAVRAELERARRQVRCGQAEALSLQGLAGAREAEGQRRQALLEEELQRRQQEARRAGARLEEARGRCEELGAETEALRRELEERGRLDQQLSERKLEIKQLKTELDQRDARLSGLEQKCRKQQKGLSQQSRWVAELTQAKQQLTATLEAQSTQLLSLTEEQEELKRLLSSTVEEHEGVAVKLSSQLQSARAELDRARGSLRALEGADGHGMRVAMGMQEQVTAKREQVDSLHGRIQLLEETLERLSHEKRHQSLESRRQVQELASVGEEKRRLQAEVEALRRLERELREKVAKLETALHKMSESFVDCQDHLQTQEQQFMRLKLQHALDLKELQGQNRRPPGCRVQRESLSSAAGVAALPCTAPQCARGPPELGPPMLEENPTLELRSLVEELQGVIFENHRPHATTSHSSRLHRRRSAPDRVLAGATLNEVTKGTKETIELYPPQTPDVDERNERNVSRTLSRESPKVFHTTSLPSYTTSPQAVLPGRMSPVHSLLTSEPSNASRSQRSPAVGPLEVASSHADLTSHACKGLHGKLENLQTKVEDLQIQNQEMSSMIKVQDRRMRRTKDKERRQQS
ncbi:coiled-coil domain-containing protein 158-like [Osmerus mordax]|uniref:coiled-coil domain-containing protein 158-like n=1 Tax=Osmerus mordax TaxID=8014 RepID=UPI0035101916